MKKARIVKIFEYILIPIVGLICILFPHELVPILPYVVGIAMILVAMLHETFHYMKKHPGLSKRFAMDLILVVLAILIMIKGSDAIAFMGTVWGIIGIRSFVNEFQHIIEDREKYKYHIGSFAFSFVEFALSLMLIFDPSDKIGHHIVMLGMEMIATSVLTFLLQEEDCKERHEKLDHM